MRRNLLLLTGLALTFLAASCGSLKKKKTDDDFYDFNKKESTELPKKEEQTEVTYDTNTPSQETKEDAEPATYTKVAMRSEKVDVVRGAIDYKARYFIILGSFSVEDNANKLVRRLAKQGFAPNILRSPSGMYRVSGYYFNDEKAARMEVDAIRKKYPEYDDLWLLIKK